MARCFFSAAVFGALEPTGRTLPSHLALNAQDHQAWIHQKRWDFLDLDHGCTRISL